MKSRKRLGRHVCGSMMALSASCLLVEASSAVIISTEKRIAKLFLTSGRVGVPRYRGRLSSGEAP